MNNNENNQSLERQPDQRQFNSILESLRQQQADRANRVEHEENGNQNWVRPGNLGSLRWSDLDSPHVGERRQPDMTTYRQMRDSAAMSRTFRDSLVDGTEAMSVILGHPFSISATSTHNGTALRLYRTADPELEGIRPTEAFSNQTRGQSNLPQPVHIPDRRENRSVNAWRDRCNILLPTNAPDALYSPPRIDAPCSKGYALDIAVHTWTRDSHDLFDYEAAPEKIKRHVLTVMVTQRNEFAPQLLCRISYDTPEGPAISVVIVDTSIGDINKQLNEPDAPGIVTKVELLLQVLIEKTQNSDGEYYYCAKISRPDAVYSRVIPHCTSDVKDIYEIVRDKELETRSTILEEDMELKLGRYPVRVRQLISASGEAVYPQLTPQPEDLEAINRTRVIPPEEAAVEGMQCRICLGEESAHDDPFVSACACRGSIQYIHASCLKYWFKNISNDSSNDPDSEVQTQCHIKAAFCELCKAQFPPWIEITDEHGDKVTYDLTAVSKVQPPFIVFESLQPGTAQRIFANSLVTEAPSDDNPNPMPILKVGRGHESSMRIADVSISRIHTEIRLNENDQFVLTDLGSKFGTLIKCRAPIVLAYGPGDPQAIEVEGSPTPHNMNTRSSLQCGRSVVDCILRPLTDEEEAKSSTPQKQALQNQFPRKSNDNNCTSASSSDLRDVDTMESDPASRTMMYPSLG